MFIVCSDITQLLELDLMHVSGRIRRACGNNAQCAVVPGDLASTAKGTRSRAHCTALILPARAMVRAPRYV
jgi:hypothetical protein